MTDLRALIRDHGLRPVGDVLRLARAAYAAGAADAKPKRRRAGWPGYGSTEAEREVIRRVVEARESGQSLRAIAAMLDAEGVPSASGKPWTAQAISNIARRAAE